MPTRLCTFLSLLTMCNQPQESTSLHRAYRNRPDTDCLSFSAPLFSCLSAFPPSCCVYFPVFLTLTVSASLFILLSLRSLNTV
ncbi:hypothetical protein FKM82_028526 [Ascaphus truei]